MIQKIKAFLVHLCIKYLYEDLYDWFDTREAEECKEHTDRLLNKIGDYIASEEPVYIICSKTFGEDAFGIQFGMPNGEEGTYEGHMETRPEKTSHLSIVEDE